MESDALQVDYDSTLDLAPFTSQPKGSQHMYDLYAVIVHHGRSVSSGHYLAYVKAPNGYWWLCDDTNIKDSEQPAQTYWLANFQIKLCLNMASTPKAFMHL